VDDGPLSPAQRRILDELFARGATRPTFPDDIAVQLRDELESALREATADLGVRELYVNKKALAQVLACEAHHVAMRDQRFDGWSPRTARGTVAHKAIELSVHHKGEYTPLELVDAAVERLLDDPDDHSPGRWLASAAPPERAELRAGVNELVSGFLECWPRLQPAWHPRTESVSRVELCDDRVVLSGKVDLALGVARGCEARTLVVDLKSGTPYASHVDDLRFYALLHTIRTGVPPFRIASYYLDSATFHPEDVTGELLFDIAVPRVVLGVTRLAALATRQRPAVEAPGPSCGWCPRRETCDGARRWAEQRAEAELGP
jgi:hypothetical protein